MLLVVYWIVGLGFMINFARFVLYGRQVFRPGLLWFIRDPNDPEYHPMREILEDRMVPQLFKLFRSVCMYCGFIVGGVFGTCWVARHLIKGVFPLNWKQRGGIESYGLFVCLVPGLLSWYHTKDLVLAGLGWAWRQSCGWWRLSEFVVGERRWAQEGTWYYKGYQVPRLLCLGKDRWVEDKCKELMWFDMARQSVEDQMGSNCLPTTEYKQKVQQHLQYPDGNWEFILDGENLRVPRSDVVPVVKGRYMLVPVDDFGRPKDSMHDYETADDLEKRQQAGDIALPRAAPESSYRRQKFNPKDYMVLYSPPHLRWRMFGFVGTVWGLLVGSLVLVLITTMVAGRWVQRRVQLDRGNDMTAFALGLVATVGGLIGVRKGWMSMTMTRSEVRKQLSKTWAAVWKTQVTGLLFVGVLPLLYGALLEVYVVIGLRERLGIEKRGWLRAMASNWLFCATQLLVVKTVVPAMWPNSQIARELDRDFTGPFHTWQVGRAIRRLWWPVVQLCAVLTVTPFLLVAGHFYWTGQHEFGRVVMLRDTEMLSWYSHVNAALLGIVVGGYQGSRMYREWWRMARDREYLVGQQLHNLAN